MDGRLHIRVLQGVDMAYRQTDVPGRHSVGGSSTTSSTTDSLPKSRRSAKSAWKLGLELARKFVERSNSSTDDQGDGALDSTSNSETEAKATLESTEQNNSPTLSDFGEKEEDLYPVIQLKLGDQVFRTEPAPSVSGGKFDDEFTFQVDDSLLVPGSGNELPFLELVCEECNTGRFLGQVHIPIARLPERHSIEQWYQMDPAPYGNSSQQVRGAIQMRIKYDATTIRTTPAIVAKAANKLPSLVHRSDSVNPNDEKVRDELAAALMNPASAVESNVAENNCDATNDETTHLPCRLVDYITVVGVDQVIDPGIQEPMRVSPKLRYRYPANNNPEYVLPDKVEWFCFPTGTKVIRRGFNDPSPPDPVFQKFVNSASECQTYGYSLVFYELLCVNQLPTGRVSSYAPACITFISRIPLEELFEKLLEQYLLLSIVEELKQSSGIPIMLRNSCPRLPTLAQVTLFLTREAPLPVPGALDIEFSLLSIEASTTSNKVTGTSNEKYLKPSLSEQLKDWLEDFEQQVGLEMHNTRGFKYETEESGSMSRISKNRCNSIESKLGARYPSEISISAQCLGELAGRVSPVRYSLPRLGGLPLNNKAVGDLLDLLGPRNLIELWSAAMLENRILVHSKQQHLLSLVGESIAGLLYPFECQIVSVPILPVKLLVLFDSPVSYLFGIHSDCVELLTSEQLCDTLVVNMDECCLGYYGSNPDGIQLPPLPKQVYSKLLRNLRSIQTSSTSPPRGFCSPQEFVSYLDPDSPRTRKWPSETIGEQHKDSKDYRIRLAFLDAIVSLLHGYRECLFLLNNELPVFNQSRFLSERQLQEEMQERGEITQDDESNTPNANSLRRRTSAAHNESEMFLVELFKTQTFEVFKDRQQSRRLALFHCYYDAFGKRRQERLRQATVAAAMRSSSIVKDQRFRVAKEGSVLTSHEAENLATMHTRRKYQLERNNQVWRSRMNRSQRFGNQDKYDVGLLDIDEKLYTILSPQRQLSKSKALFSVPYHSHHGHPRLLDAESALHSNLHESHRNKLEQLLRQGEEGESDHDETHSDTEQVASFNVRRGRAFSSPYPENCHHLDTYNELSHRRNELRRRPSGSVGDFAPLFAPVWEEFILHHSHDFHAKRRTNELLSGAITLDFVQPRSWDVRDICEKFGLGKEWLMYTLKEQRAVYLPYEVPAPPWEQERANAFNLETVGKRTGQTKHEREQERSVQDCLTKIFFDEALSEENAIRCAKAFDYYYARDLFTLTLRQSQSVHERHYMTAAGSRMNQGVQSPPQSPNNQRSSPRGSPRGGRKRFAQSPNAFRDNNRGSSGNAAPWRTGSRFSGVAGWSFRGDGRVLDERSFADLVRVSRDLLDVCARKEDYRNGRLLLQVSVAYQKFNPLVATQSSLSSHTQQGGARSVDLRSQLHDVALWKNLLFWEHAVAESLGHEKELYSKWCTMSNADGSRVHLNTEPGSPRNKNKSSNVESSSGEMEPEVFHEVVFELMTNICSAMIHVGAGEDITHVFVTRVASMYGLTDILESTLHKLVTNIFHSYIESNNQS